jgi:hypothetical protein
MISVALTIVMASNAFGDTGIVHYCSRPLSGIESGQIKKGSNDENFTQEAAFDASRCHRVCRT